MRAQTFEEAMSAGDDVTELVLDRKAKPDVLVKYYIINAWALASRYEAVMKYNRFFIFKDAKFGREDEANYRSAVLLVWSLSKFMIADKIDDIAKVKEKRAKYDRDKSLFALAEAFEYGTKPLTTSSVIRVKNFIFEYLHLMHVTNLLMSDDSTLIEGEDLEGID